MCRFCARLARQLHQIRTAARQPLPNTEPDPGLEDRLLRRLSRR
jgi:hypothetical protein